MHSKDNRLNIFINNEKINELEKSKSLVCIELDFDKEILLDQGRSFFCLANTSNGNKYRINLRSWSLSNSNFTQKSNTLIYNEIFPKLNIDWPFNVLFNNCFFDECDYIFSFIFKLRISHKKL